MSVGRNAPCPCGSGKRYKHCCGMVLTQGQHSDTRPRDVDTLLDAADALQARGRHGESVPLYQRALEIDPRTVEAHNNLGNAFLKLGEPGQAAACYRRALEIRPKEADIHCNLGNALRQQGQLEEAIACSRRAIALNPRLSMAHNNLGLALAGLGEREQAVASYGQALALNPRYVEALDNLGNALRDLGQRREALEIYRQAVELNPRRPEAHCNVGDAFFELRKLEEAATAFRQALVLRAEFARAHLGLALTRRQQRRPAEAEEACQAALRIDPNDVDALAHTSAGLALLGELRADRGQFDDAEKLFRRALEIDPSSSSAHASIAMHRKMTREDTRWLQDAEALLAKQLPLRQEVGLRYALGKYFDDLGENDRAFEQYRCANELTKRQGARYDRAKLTARVDQILRDFDAAQRAPQERASLSEVPVFIVGMPRSGTSLTEQILASHPHVFGAGEIPFWNTAYEAYRSAQQQSDTTAIRLSDLARDYLVQLASIHATSPRVVDKMPANFMYAGLIHIAFPRARIIHMRRHPLDTCLSIYFQNFFNIGPYTNDLDDLAHYYGEYVRLTSHWRAVLPRTAWLDVPYEELIADQEQWTRRMLDFVGLEWDPRCLEFQNTDRVVITASKWQVRQKMTATSAGRWRGYEKYVAPLRHLVDAAS